jgi:hypothetical protein
MRPKVIVAALLVAHGLEAGHCATHATTGDAHLEHRWPDRPGCVSMVSVSAATATAPRCDGGVWL